MSGALKAYEKAVSVSNQREVKLLCLHEVAWCHLIRLNYKDAHTSLSKLQEESRWSKSFYAYLAAGFYLSFILFFILFFLKPGFVLWLEFCLLEFFCRLRALFIACCIRHCALNQCLRRVT